MAHGKSLVQRKEREQRTALFRKTYPEWQTTSKRLMTRIALPAVAPQSVKGIRGKAHG